MCQRVNSPVHIACIDMKDKKAEIYEPQKLAEFRGKRHIAPVLNREQFFSQPRKRSVSMSSSKMLSEAGYLINEKCEGPGLR